jgi:PAS domain S-box-containing protein
MKNFGTIQKINLSFIIAFLSALALLAFAAHHWWHFAAGILLCICIAFAYSAYSQSIKLFTQTNFLKEQNNAIIHNVSEAIITANEQWIITDWNANAEDVYGYKKEAVVGKNLNNVLSGNVSSVVDILNNANRISFLNGEDVTHIHQNGHEIHVQISTSKIKISAAGNTENIVLVTDITKQVRLQDELKKISVQQAQSVNQKALELGYLFERISDAFFALDNDWNYTYLNKSAIALHNKEEESLIGKNIWLLFPHLVGGDFYNALHSAKELQQPQRHEFHDAITDRWYDDLIYPGEDGISLYYHDVTEKKKAEIGLKTAHARLNFHLNNTPLAVIEFDSNLNIMQWSKMAEEIFGWTAAEVHEKGINIEALIHENDRDLFYTKLQTLALQPNADNIITNRGLSKTGKEIYCEWYNSFLKDDNNKMGVVLSFVKDVTAKNIIQTELINAEAKFRGLVEQSIVGVYLRKGNKLLYVSPRFAEIMGYGQAELYGDFSVYDLVSDEDKVRILDITDNYDKGKIKSHHYEYKANHKTGRTIDVEVFGSVMMLDGEEVIIGTLLDISERKIASEQAKMTTAALNLTNERFELVAQATNDAIWDWDMHTDQLSGNESFCRLFEIPVGSYIKFQDFIDRVHPEEVTRITDNYNEALASKQTLLTEEFRFKQKNGTYKVVFDRAYILYNNKKDAYRMLGAMQDITTQKEIEQKLLLEKELSDSLINSLPGIFALFNKAGKFYRWNKNFETVTGYNAAEIKKMNALDFFVENGKDLALEKIKNVFENGNDFEEGDLLLKNGQKIPYHFTGMLTNYENEECLLGIGVDISEREKAQEALINSEHKYRLLFNENPLPMWILDPAQDKFLDVNNSAVKIYGYSKKEFLNMPITGLHPKNNTGYLNWNAKTEEEKLHAEMSWMHQKKDGSIVKVIILSNEILFENKKAFLVMANDVTDKLEAEEKLEKSKEAFRELAAHLETVRESERTHMAREIHDELGQQLTGLKMDISWINKKVKSDDIAVQVKMNDTLELIDKTVITVRRIATQLRPSILDDLGLISAMDWQSEEFQKRSEISSIFTSNVTHVSVSPDMATGIFRIYQECLTNVSRHSRATEVVSSLNIENDTLTLIIEDNGIGFKEADIINKKTLGLLGMKERVALIKGTYQINGNNGNGTSVIISVPLNLSSIILQNHI